MTQPGKRPPETVEERLSNAEDAFMRRAIELSHKAMDEGAGPPFGAVIVRDGQVVAEGCNLTNPLIFC